MNFYQKLQVYRLIGDHHSFIGDPLALYWRPPWLYIGDPLTLYWRPPWLYIGDPMALYWRPTDLGDPKLSLEA